ncbi:MAG: RNA polymerase sigma-54 factor, partial [bacterium]|nr:RNA polymerase sigma-54 factor [bacterium]
CLLIQLNHLGYKDSLAWKMVSLHLDDMERRRYPAIAKALKVTEEEVAAAREIISALSPKPGAGLGSDETRYIFPDILIEKHEGEYVIIINDRVVPRVRVTPDYKKILLRSKTAKPEERDYVVKRLEAARFIVRMIEQRRRTVQKIMLAIVDRQRQFLDHGLRQFKPLTMRQVADDIGMHESTVSRAVHNKYALTPHGMVAVRYFFGGGMNTTQGQDSVKAIKDKVLEMIKNEDPKSPLTDQDITDALAKAGLKIARRTIAKYRQEGKILPASIRKNP